MAIAQVGTTGSSVWAATGTSLILTPPQTSTVGNKLIAYGMLGGSPSSVTCSDNSTQAGTANVWTEVGTVLVNATVAITIWWCDCTRPLLTSDRATISWTTTMVRQGGMGEWSGVATGAPANSHTASGTGTSQNTGALSTATAGDLVLGLFCYGAAVAYTVGTDGQGNTMSVLSQPTPAQVRASLIEYLVESGAQAFTPDATTASGTSNYVARAIRFNAAVTVPVNSVAPAVTGNKYTGQVLTTTTGTWSNTPTSYAYAWKRAGTPIASATANNYTLQVADVASAITVSVTATNASGSGTPATGTPSVTAGPAYAPTISSGKIDVCANAVVPGFTPGTVPHRQAVAASLAPSLAPSIGGR